MGVITTFTVIVLALKTGIAGVSVAGLAYGANWFHKLNFKSKKGGGMGEGELEGIERFNRHDI